MTNEDIAREIRYLAEKTAGMIASDKLSRLLVGAKIRFPKDNKLPYCQDMCFFRGVPDLEWDVVGALGFGLRLQADGYGRKGDYGNGNIFVEVCSQERESRP